MWQAPYLTSTSIMTIVAEMQTAVMPRDPQAKMRRAGADESGQVSRSLTELPDPATDVVTLAASMGVPGRRCRTNEEAAKVPTPLPLGTRPLRPPGGDADRLSELGLLGSRRERPPPGRPGAMRGRPDTDHPFLGTVDDWLYQHLAGIQAARPGYDTVRISPVFPAELEHASATVPPHTARSRRPGSAATTSSPWRSAFRFT
jgi:hypothetical protein